MGDSVLPEIGLLFSLFVITRMLQIVLAPDRKSTDATVYAFATVTAIVAGIGVVNMGVLVARNWLTRFISFLALCVLCSLPLYAQIVTDMTPERIAEAITEGQAKKVKPYEAGDCRFTTPYLRIALASSAAKAAYKPFSHSDVTPDMIAPELEVYVPTDHGSPRRGYGLFSATSVVIMPKGSADVTAAIQPLRTAPVTERYQNAYGASVDAQAVIARFPLSALGDRHEIRVRYNDGGERRHGLKIKGVR